MQEAVVKAELERVLRALVHSRGFLSGDPIETIAEKLLEAFPALLGSTGNGTRIAALEQALTRRDRKVDEIQETLRGLEEQLRLILVDLERLIGDPAVTKGVGMSILRGQLTRALVLQRVKVEKEKDKDKDKEKADGKPDKTAQP